MIEIFTKKLPALFYSYIPSLRKEYATPHAMNAIFAKIESMPFRSFSNLTQRVQVTQEIKNISVEGKTIEEWLKLGNEQLTCFRSQPLYKHERLEWNRLEEQLLALSYRSGALEKGNDRQKGSFLLGQFEPILLDYLASPAIFPGRATPVKLTPQERAQLEHTCIAYPALIEKFIERSKNKNDPWIQAFVKWVLRSGCNVGVFVKAPNEKNILASAHLDKRSGTVHGRKGIHFGNVLKGGLVHRAVCLNIDGTLRPVQGKYKNKEVTLKNIVDPMQPGMTLTVEKIIDIFKKKTHGYGYVEYIDGVSNWNSIELASYNASAKQYTHLNPDHLLDQLFEKIKFLPLTEEQMRNRYENFSPLIDGQWAYVVKASRLKPNLNILETHGYSDVVRRRGDLYYIVPLSIQPKDLPTGFISRFLMLTATKKAQLHTPDESHYLSNRDQIALLFPLDDQELIRLRKTITETYRLGKNGELYFQLTGDNCAFQIQKIFDNVIAAPFFEKIESLIQTYLSSKSDNFISRTILRNDSVRAFQGLNHDLLKNILNMIVKDLCAKQNLDAVNELLFHSTALLGKIYTKPFDVIRLKKEDLSEPEKRKMIEKLLFQTVESARFYRMDLFRSETDQPFLKFINKIIDCAPWRWLKTLIVNIVLFFMGSWRWVITHTPQEQGTTKLSVKNLASNRLVQEAYLNHPAALWEWVQLRDGRLKKIERYITNLE